MEAPMTLNSELREATVRAGDKPARLDDPLSNTSFVVLRAKIDDRMKARLADDEQDQSETDAPPRRSKRNRQAMIADDRE